MTHELMQAFLGWCFAVNYGVLFVWFLCFTLGHDWLFALHSRWFKLSVELFDAINYLCMGFYKLSIILFNLTPYLVLKYLI